MKNADAKLFRTLQQFKSATRILITGTPLQNNLKELWSLLHFLMPKTFMDWEAFEVWFDFSDLEDEEGTQQFIGDQQNQELVKKIHKVLQPLLLRRIKADVAAYLPKKREYVLYAPMTKEQTDLYNVISDKGTDTRAYLEYKVFERLTSTNSTTSPLSSGRASRQSSRAATTSASEATSPVVNNAFSIMMGKRGPGRPPKNGKAPTSTTPSTTPAKAGTKRREAPAPEFPEPKSRKSSAQSTPSVTSRGRGRPRRNRRNYQVADDSEDDKLGDDEFEAKLVAELEAAQRENDDMSEDDEESMRTTTLELASKIPQIQE
jgi:ATP-dependent DNA helicase